MPQYTAKYFVIYPLFTGCVMLTKTPAPDLMNSSVCFCQIYVCNLYMSQMCKLLKQYKTVRPKKNMHSYWRLLLLFFLYARPTYFKYSEKFRDWGKHWSVAIGMMRIMLFLLNVAIADNQSGVLQTVQVGSHVGIATYMGAQFPP